MSLKPHLLCPCVISVDLNLLALMGSLSNVTQIRFLCSTASCLLHLQGHAAYNMTAMTG